MPSTTGYTGVAIYFVIFLVIFYVLVVMPRKKQEKKHKQTIEELKRGDRIVTIGGIKGEISKIKEDSVILRVGENTEIEFVKKAIAYKEEE